jgi:hypothetical protein
VNKASIKVAFVSENLLNVFCSILVEIIVGANIININNIENIKPIIKFIPASFLPQ